LLAGHADLNAEGGHALGSGFGGKSL